MQDDHTIKYLYPAKGGRWKYGRDVPRSMQRLLGRVRWDYSLGSDYMKALKKWANYSEEHDQLIDSLKTDAGKQAYQKQSEKEQSARMLQLMVHTGLPATINNQAEVWRKTESVMSQARSSDPEKEWQRLAQFSAYAFGDKTLNSP